MKSYVILYREDGCLTELDQPFVFVCLAEDTDHAEEQCLNAYPECNIVWVYQGDNAQDALDDYYCFDDYLKR